jgi:signal transduction histidine kinase
MDMDQNLSYTDLDAGGFDTIHAILGHIAHDFGNLVTPLLAYPDLIKGELEEGSFGQGLVEQIEKTAADMARIVQQLQMLSNREEGDCEALDLSRLVSDVVMGLHTGEKPESVDIDLNLAEEPLSMDGNVLQLTSAVHALCRNAIESMPEGGAVTVATARVAEEPRTTRCGSRLEPRDYLQMSVSDQGTGVPEYIRDSIFTPFVTSKNSSHKRGSGLGLSIAYKAVRDHGGYIDFTARPDGGTVFSLGIPG